MKVKPPVPDFFHLLLLIQSVSILLFTPGANPSGLHPPAPLLSGFQLGQPRIRGQKENAVKDLFTPQFSPCQIASGWLCLLIKGHSSFSRKPSPHTTLSGFCYFSNLQLSDLEVEGPGCNQPPGPALPFWLPYTLPTSS